MHQALHIFQSEEIKNVLDVPDCADKKAILGNARHHKPIRNHTNIIATQLGTSLLTLLEFVQITQC